MTDAPPFTLRKVGADSTWSLQQAENKPVMLTFWTTWCPDSLRDLEAKQRLYATIDRETLEMIMIHVSGRDPDANVEQFLKKHDYTFPVLCDEGTKVYDLYRCTSVPTTVLLNDDHKIFAKYDDRATMFDVMKGIANLFKESPHKK